MGMGASGMAPTWRMDPRPDLIADHDLWELLLTKVVQDDELGWVLNGARCAGCRLVWDKDRLKLEPILNPKLGFDNESDWLELRDKWLAPMQTRIADALRRLAQTQQRQASKRKGTQGTRKVHARGRTHGCIRKIIL